MDINKIKNELIKQKELKFKGNIYHYSQVNFSYNSNKIEGSRLTSDQTEAIFDTSSFIPKSDELIKLDDLIESRNHFKLFDYMLDNVDNGLSKEMIIEMNKILKRNTSDEENPRYNVGGFKIVPNMIGLVNVINTTAPEKVEEEIESLLSEYNSKYGITLEDIIDFHYKFEKIHPFGDGNGRVGRIIMFKECLRNNIMPFVVLDDDKPYYMRGLKDYENDKMFLIDTIKHEQDLYEKICEKLLNFEIEERINYADLLEKLVEDYKINSVINPFIICFIGGPGYGKSFLSKLISKRKQIPIVSNDKTRRLLDSLGLNSTNQEVVHKLAYLQMEYLIKHHSSMIIDANAIRQHSVISKKAKELNVKCYYVNLICNQDIILERLDYRESQFGKDDNYSRATKKDYLDYQEEVKSISFPAEKVFFEIKTNEELGNQVEKLFEKIESDV